MWKVDRWESYSAEKKVVLMVDKMVAMSVNSMVEMMVGWWEMKKVVKLVESWGNR